MEAVYFILFAPWFAPVSWLVLILSVIVYMRIRSISVVSFICFLSSLIGHMILFSSKSGGLVEFNFTFQLVFAASNSIVVMLIIWLGAKIARARRNNL